MANLLKKLKLTELSLVDRPANPLAMAPIFKRDESQEEQMTKDIDKSKDLEASVETLKAELETLKLDNERLRKSLIDNDFVIKSGTIEKKAPVEFLEVDGEKINKADVPDVILKRLEVAEAERVEASVTKKADELLPNFDKEVAKEFVKMDLSDEVLQALKAADALFEGMMTEKGEASAEADMTEPKDKLDALVTKYMDDNSVDIHKARTEVAKTSEGRELQKAVMKGSN